jgi:hypothetical protein
MRTAERDMWRCDKREKREGEKYVEMKKIIKGKIKNEVEMKSE